MNTQSRFLFVLFFCFLPLHSAWADEKLVVDEGKLVKMHYTIKSEGKVVETTKKNGPVQFRYGKDVLYPIFEKNIVGMKAGEKKKFQLLPEEGFGHWDMKEARIIPRAELPDKKLKPGMILTARRPYSTETITGRVTKIIGDEVGMDFNHPLAGKTLQVEVKILEVS